MNGLDAPIRRVGVGLVVLLLLLVGQLTYLQVVRSDELANDPRNFRVTRREVRHARGLIITADGVVVAKSVPSHDDLVWDRVYPHGPLYAHITGYQSLIYGTTGIERTYNDVLLGRELTAGPAGLDSLLQKDAVQNVRLTVSAVAQEAAAQALRDREGSVVVLDVNTGGIVAMYSNPTYDPNQITDHNITQARNEYSRLTKDPTNPMLSRAYRQIFPPGSTFKVVTAAAGLERGVATADTRYPVIRQLALPQNGGTVSNFGKHLCGGTLADSLRLSCNTSFAQLGLDLGNGLASTSTVFGFESDAPPLDIAPGPARSRGPIPGTFQHLQPLFARDAIGQADVLASPLLMALVAESVATGGTMLTPHLLAQVEDSDTTVARTAPVQAWRRVMSRITAEALSAMMQSVVANGTGTAARIPGIAVAGKTGTSQTIKGRAPHAWFIGFAPANAPKYAVAVIVEHGGDVGNEATGGRVAAPVARDVLQALLTPR